MLHDSKNAVAAINPCKEQESHWGWRNVLIKECSWNVNSGRLPAGCGEKKSDPS